MLGEDSSNLHAISSELPAFQRSEGIDVIPDPADFTTALTKATTDFSTGAGHYDIVLQYNFSLSQFVRNRYVYTIAELKRMAANGTSFAFETNLLENVWRELGYYSTPPFTDFQSMQPIAYPFAANTMILAYNRRVLADQAVSAA